MGKWSVSTFGGREHLGLLLWLCESSPAPVSGLRGWDPVNKETFITSTERTVIMSFNWRQNKQFKLPNVFV